MEPMAATAHVHDGQAEIWLPTQAPAFARAAVAKALDLAESDVILYPLMAGGSFGRKMEADAAVQAAIIAREMNRPVQLLRSEEHTSELQSLMRISYAVFCLKKKNKQENPKHNIKYRIPTHIRTTNHTNSYILQQDK